MENLKTISNEETSKSNLEEIKDYVEEIQELDSQSAAKFSDEHYTALKRIIRIYNNSKKRRYFILAECNICKELRLLEQKHLHEYKCVKCQDKIKYGGYVGRMFGQQKVLKYLGKVLVKTNPVRYNQMFEIECQICGNIQQVTLTYLDGVKNGCQKCKTFRATTEAPLNYYYYNYKRNAGNRNLSFDLTKEEFFNIIKQDCYYCGQAPEEYKSINDRNKTETIIKVNGVDRINNNKGYCLDNVVPCCAMCNFLKGKFNQQEFLNKVFEITEHQKKSSTTISKESTLQV